MADYVGRIPVPEIIPVGVFPIVPDFGYGRQIAPALAVHQFGSGDAKVEQRYYLGSGAKRFRVRRAGLSPQDRIALRDFWESCRGPGGAFTYNAPLEDQSGTTPYLCRFEAAPLSLEMLGAAIASTGVTLIEIPTSTPSYPINQVLERFPDQLLETSLLAGVQELIPLMKLEPRESGYPTIYLSDRRVTIGAAPAVTYLPRLLEISGVSQAIGSEADQAEFVLGNADRVMRDLANDVDLSRARIEFSLFHVGTAIKLDLWKGEVISWSMDSGAEFRLSAADGIYELRLPYPCRKTSRSCWKRFDDGAACPFASRGHVDYVNFPGASAGSCDKGYETGNGCRAHAMERYYGGVLSEPQGVRIKDNSTGVWGFRRSSLTSVSLVSESVYDQVLPEIYTNRQMPVNCKIAAGRDESDFYAALGIVGEGPITFGSGHKLDDQYHHGYPGSLGLRYAPGSDPAGDGEYFAIGQSGDQTGGDWRKAYYGASTYRNIFAAGTAFLEMRRSDQKGLQLSRPGDHAMQAIVALGLQGWIWTAPGARHRAVLTNPVWIFVNMLLRGLGLGSADAATCEEQFEVSAAIAAAAICDLQVQALYPHPVETWVEDQPGYYDQSGNWIEPSGSWRTDYITSESQFTFRGVLQEEKPLRDWLQEVLMNCLGYYSFAFGKAKIGIRTNSSAAEAFTLGNILFGSLRMNSVAAGFNHLTANFADEEFEYANNAVTLYDIDHAELIGRAVGRALYVKGDVNLVGTPHKSQAARIVATRLREELGGVSDSEWRKARHYSFKTTVLALNVEPGMVCSLTHPDLPDGYGEFRVSRWRLNADYSIDIEGRTTTDSMYDLVAGPKPADVEAMPFPRTMRDLLPRPPFGWLPYAAAPPGPDPIVDETEFTFGLWPAYEIAADGAPMVSLVLTGKLPVNQLSSLRQPIVSRAMTISPSGGALAGGKTYYAVLCARDAAGKYTESSDIARAIVPAGSNANALTLGITAWPDGAPGGYAIFAGEKRDRLAWQANGAGTPTQIDITGPLKVATWGVPDGEFDRLRIKVKRVLHSGCFGQQVGGVGAGWIRVAGGAFTANQWAGYSVSILGLWDRLASGASGDQDTFSGAGLDDLTSGNGYVGPARAIFEVTIDATGTPDSFKWRKDGGTWNVGVAIDGTEQALSDGLTVLFGATTGHTLHDTWRICVGDELPILNYAVTANDQDTLQVGLGRNPLTDGVKVGDVIVMRFRPIAGATTIGDPNVQNSFHPGGATNDETGNLIRILAGTGAGQVRKIASNTPTEWTVERAWDVLPDTSSIFIVERPEWEARTETTPLSSEDPLRDVEVSCRVDNLLRQTVLVQAVAIDGGSHETPEADSPAREIYLFGRPGFVTPDWDRTIIDDADPLEAGSDLSNWYRISEDATLGVDLLEWTAQLKAAPVSGPVVANIEVSTDGGATWSSMFGIYAPTIPIGSLTAEGTIFALSRLNRDDIFRYGLSEADGTAAVLTFVLRGKKVTP